jgi:hypothetical protein
VKMFLPAEPITGVAPKVAAEKFPKENPWNHANMGMLGIPKKEALNAQVMGL